MARTVSFTGVSYDSFGLETGLGFVVVKHKSPNRSAPFRKTTERALEPRRAMRDMRAMKILVPIVIIFHIISAWLSGAYAMDIRPDPDRTQGAVRIDGDDPGFTCGNAAEHRGHMTNSRRNEVQRRYGLPTGTHPDYEIDHLIPLCLGGADEPANLWPEPRKTIEPVWNAERKDRLEHRLCALVCAGKVEIGQAQQEIAADWVKAYEKYVQPK